MVLIGSSDVRGSVCDAPCSAVSGTVYFFFSSRRRHTRSDRDWSSDVCSSDLVQAILPACAVFQPLQMGPYLTQWLCLNEKPTTPADYLQNTLTVSASTAFIQIRSEEHTSELQSRSDLVCRLLLEKKKKVRVPATARGSRHAKALTQPLRLIGGLLVKPSRLRRDVSV